ncbi:MAG: indolepyruvate ferredoxin oxidoreductase family protein, partial [Sneathiella sp.]|nr:indolepyruvate ferredoxin oxidoreductase family protein [Sneathiella sp.]
SGSLAIRAALAANTNITYKILYNDAVAMTGGQANEGGLDAPRIAAELVAMGIKKLVVVYDEKEDVDKAAFPKGIEMVERAELDRVQRALRDIKGTTAIVYVQTCAAEKRRRRKRGTYPDPAKRVLINDLVCEGCGDCSVKSNCISVEPLETEFGRKRVINQSSCNKDFSCVKGFCPSFVTIEGGQLRKAAPSESKDPSVGLPLPKIMEIENPYRILITGIGGTGVVTIGALLAMAAHLENKGVTVLDQAGLAQKGGAVTSHIHIAPKPEHINAVRIPAGRADLLIGCDLVVAGSDDSLAKLDVGVANAVINSHPAPTMDFTLNPDAPFPVQETLSHIIQAVGEDACHMIEASTIATTLMGDAIATNLFMLGYSFQKGFIPLSLEALMRAIELNGIAIDSNKRAFAWGRSMAHDPDSVLEEVSKLSGPQDILLPTDDLEEMISRRIEFLSDYQDRNYALRYQNIIRKIQTAENKDFASSNNLTRAATRSLFKLMAYKDEYEVARLYTQTGFFDKVDRMMEGDYKIKFNLAPPLFAKKDSETGQLLKKEYGPWVAKAFGTLAKFKKLRGTALDPFGYTAERREERKLIGEFEKTLEEILSGLNSGNYAIAQEIVELPMNVRGYGHVKEAAIKTYRLERDHLMTAFHNPAQQTSAAE